MPPLCRLLSTYYGCIYLPLATLIRYHIPEAPEAGGPVQISVSEIQAWCVPKPEGAEEEEAEGEGEGVVTSGPYVEVSLLEVEGAGHLTNPNPNPNPIPNPNPPFPLQEKGGPGCRALIELPADTKDDLLRWSQVWS